MKRNYFKMILNVFSTAFTYSNYIVYQLFYFWKITFTNICCKIDKTGMNLWMVYICNIMWRALESTIRKDGKKVNVLYIVELNHQRAMIVVDNSRSFNGI